MLTKKLKVFLFILIAVTVIIFTIVILVILNKRQTITFSNSETKLEVKEINFLEKRLLKNQEINTGKLIILSEPTGAEVIIRPLASAAPLTFKGETFFKLVSPQEINFEPGLYWINASKLNYNVFSNIFYIFPSKENKFKIVLKPIGDLAEPQAFFTEEDKKAEVKVKEYYQKYPLANFLPYITDHFKIYSPTEENVYIIELFPTASLVTENSLYQKQKEQYKEEALTWISEKKFNINGLKIKFVPE